MSVEHELGQLTGELNGVKREQCNIKQGLDELRTEIIKLSETMPVKCAAQKDVCNTKIDGKVGWRNYLWITAVLITVVGTLLGITYGMADVAEHRSQINEYRIDRLEKVQPEMMEGYIKDYTITKDDVGGYR